MRRARYELRVSGRLSERAQHAVGAFAGLTVVSRPSETSIYADVSDDSELHQLLALIQSNGLHIAFMHQLPRVPVRKVSYGER
ncbi:MAG TPA: hypothetical protein VFV67_18525 [Actinophytocola sp.]|uniref:hypothetical protein n=1 Tax=Actinophytocola sp. TaxID=1872138 RepID=UPI002DBDD1CC|nr:hypothetical protein [Actinophytocola sp.]HEU5472646.1 hypothetical protein [Actinophytocola sp.]